MAYLSAQEQLKLLALKEQQITMLREQHHRIERRAHLLARRAPAQILNRYTEEIAETNETLRRIGAEIDYLLAVQHAGN